MSDKMTPIPFDNLMQWALQEKKQGTCFGTHTLFHADPNHAWEIFDRKLETPIGPAAGPHTQLAQNIIASYMTGSRFFELKTVQVIDGEDLPVNKPCITADDECYNCEWSTELTVPQATNEYIKAWVALKVLAQEWGLGASDGFQFNMSVGYDLEGIKSEKVNTYIETMKDASANDTFNACITWLKDNIDLFEHVSIDDVDNITPHICNSVTLSTLHGCPPQEIERISSYLINEKQLNTFIKCNPTLLGYEYARKTLDDMGYDYINFTDFHFNDDLQYEDAVPMIGRLLELAEKNHLQFGVKITNTFPVDVKNNELPSEEMYMSGKSLYPLSLEVANRLSHSFDGKLRISYSGGADAFNIDKIVHAGIWPVTMATTMLKPGGYNRIAQMAGAFAKDDVIPFDGVDVRAIDALSEEAKHDAHHVKPSKPLPSRKNNRHVPLTNCFIAPCKDTCPIHQDITAYNQLVEQGDYAQALRVILEKNPLPFMTGNICSHPCQNACTRNFYESSVHIRNNKLLAAKNGFDEVIQEVHPGTPNGKKIVIIGAGPAGIASAYFLASAGCEVRVFDNSPVAGGVVAHTIPYFRIPDADIQKDVQLAQKAGAQFVLNTEIDSVQQLMKDEGADAAIVAVGAHKSIPLVLEQGDSMNAHEFLRAFNEAHGEMDLGENIVVVGGGNTAMDTARAAIRTQGAKKVRLVYRRTRRYMPADEEELDMAIADGVEFTELLSPIAHIDNKLVCEKMELGEKDATGRCSVVATGEKVELACDTLIAAIGERVDGSYFEKNGIACDERGFAQVNPQTNESSIKDVYVAGDALLGGSIIVKCIASAQKICAHILGHSIGADASSEVRDTEIYARKGVLTEAEKNSILADARCLSCDSICENCVDVCPNRANVSIKVAGMPQHQIIHVDYMCNECGNCKTFCPYDSAPYKDKFTLFANMEDMQNSENNGFVVLDEQGSVKVRLGKDVYDYVVGKPTDEIEHDLARIIDTVVTDYSYLLLH